MQGKNKHRICALISSKVGGNGLQGKNHIMVFNCLGSVLFHQHDGSKLLLKSLSDGNYFITVKPTNNNHQKHSRCLLSGTKSGEQNWMCTVLSIS